MVPKETRLTAIASVMGALLVLLTIFVDFSEALTFALVPKRVSSSFFNQTNRGCQDAARILKNTCIYTGPLSPDKVVPEEQAEFIAAIIANGTVDGMAISVSSEEIIAPLIDQAVDAGIPVVTFDSDAPNSKRIAYVGTDNTFLGTQIAKVLKQLQPEGGTFGVISTPGANIAERENGFRYELLENSNNVWSELMGSPTSFKDHQEGLNQTQEFANLNPTAIALMLEGPMKDDNWEPLVDSNSEKGIVYVAGDDSDKQLDLLSRRKCQGLVGQLPYEMGYIAMQVLDELVRNQTYPDEIVGTNVVTHIQVPLILPPLTVDENRTGGLAIVGYILFGLVTVTAFGFIGWTYHSRKLHAVKASQPIFLIMVALGVLIMASSIIPLSFDDSTGHLGSTGICMSVPWLCFMGFSITFAALYSKTKRINKIFRSGQMFTRVKVKAQHVVIPFLVLVSLNAIVLICWTVLDPLTYVRANHAGLDGWNRVISTYGTCQSQHGYRYVIPLTLINLIVLLIANYQAYEARKIKSEFSESKYIGLAMASMLQCGVIGIPILFVVRQQPQAFYIILVLVLFIISEVVLLLIFAPKIILQDSYSRAAPEQQRQMILGAVRESQETSHAVGPSTIASRITLQPQRRNMTKSTVDASQELFSAEQDSHAKSITFGASTSGVPVLRPIKSAESTCQLRSTTESTVTASQEISTAEDKL